MTTPLPKLHPQTATWAPFPPPPPSNWVWNKHCGPSPYSKPCDVYSPRDSYHPTILVDNKIPIFYDPGTPPARQRPVAIPDCTIALGVDTQSARTRMGYDPIQLGKPPDLVIEFASRSTYRHDMTTKRAIYRDLKTLEYWMFDATGATRYGRPITGERLERGEYRQLPALRYGDGITSSTSIVLDLNFRWNGRRFTVHAPRTGEECLHPREENLHLYEANRRLQAEIRRLHGQG